MIDLIDRRLSDWIKNTLDDVEVFLTAPEAAEPGRGVGLYLLELLHTPAARTAQKPPLQITLRYLVTARADAPEEAHRLLGQLIFAALENAEFEVEPNAPAAELWGALGVAPRPSFVLRLPLRREQRPEQAAPRVRVPLVVKGAALTSLRGQVVGAGGVPVAGARVELPSASLSTRTDFEGRFTFPAVPASPRAQLLRVRAKGRDFSITAERAGDEDRTLVIHLQGLEE
jgi:Carboxypeptidase regulatory-like domain/Pvc16 N-terminal domain